MFTIKLICRFCTTRLSWVRTLTTIRTILVLHPVSHQYWWDDWLTSVAVVAPHHTTLWVSGSAVETCHAMSTSQGFGGYDVVDCGAKKWRPDPRNRAIVCIPRGLKSPWRNISQKCMLHITTKKRSMTAEKEERALQPTKTGDISRHYWTEFSKTKYTKHNQPGRTQTLVKSITNKYKPCINKCKLHV